MAYQIKSKYTFSGGDCDGLIIKYNGMHIVLEFNMYNLCRTIPYFIHCLNNHQNYTLKLDNSTMIILDDKDIICRIEHGGSYFEITIPYSYKNVLIFELSKYKCINISNNYINVMNMAECGKNILFTKQLLEYNDTGILIIDNITDDEKDLFRKLCNGLNIIIRGATYININGYIKRCYNTAYSTSTMEFEDTEITYASNNIIDIIRQPPDGKAINVNLRIDEDRNGCLYC